MFITIKNTNYNDLYKIHNNFKGIIPKSETNFDWNFFNSGKKKNSAALHKAAEAKFGSLPPNITVIHLDHDNLNNSYENIDIISSEDVGKFNKNINEKYIFLRDTFGVLHAYYNLNSKFVKQCKTCGKIFLTESVHFSSTFCSQECAAYDTLREDRKLYTKIPNPLNDIRNVNTLRLHIINAGLYVMRRKIGKNEVVILNDMDKSNNNPDNLLVFSSFVDSVKFKTNRNNRYFMELDENGAYKMVINPNSIYFKPCEYCGTIFYAKTDSIWEKKRFCCKSCSSKAKMNPYSPIIQDISNCTGLNDFIPPVQGTGIVTNININRYGKIYKNNTQEYIKLAEEKLGYKLKQEWVIHHINGNHFDNRIENLMILDSNKSHSFIHQLPDSNYYTIVEIFKNVFTIIPKINPFETRKVVRKICPNCNHPFLSFPEKNKKFCSHKCADEYTTLEERKWRNKI